jgi:hypothetical protein
MIGLEREVWKLGSEAVFSPIHHRLSVLKNFFTFSLQKLKP